MARAMQSSPAIHAFDSAQSLSDFVGRPAIRSAPMVIGQDLIGQFARITRDEQWIHVDPSRAAAHSPYRGTIAHGFLVLSLLTFWQSSCMAFPGAALVLNYGFDRIRFTAPVRSGASLSAQFTLAQVTESRPGEVRCSWGVSVGADDASRPSVHADWLMMVRYGHTGPG